MISRDLVYVKEDHGKSLHKLFHDMMSQFEKKKKTVKLVVKPSRITVTSERRILERFQIKMITIASIIQ